MFNKGFTTITLGVACAAMSLASASTSDIVNSAGQAQPLTRAQAITQFESINTRSSVSTRSNGSIARVYGKAFSQGNTAAISTQRFINQHAGMWGVDTADLVPEGPFADGRHIQPIGYLPETDSYKFTGHYYTQYSNGIEVFRSKLVLLTRNEENNPLVLASSELHDLGGFQANPQMMRQAINQDQIAQKAMVEFATNDILVWSSDRMVYAGVDDKSHTPTLADVSEVMVDGFAMFLVVTDAATGEFLYQESLIHTVDVSGNASALASDGPSADFCADEISQPLPYLSVGIAGGNTTFADENGDFTISNGGSFDVNVNATIAGQWFEVSDFLGSVESVSENVSPPGPADLVFNAANSSENIRAQVNAYIAANEVRDFAVRANPAFPTLMNESFPISVNRTDGFCPGNAWYSPGEESINFCLSSGSAPNTAWTSVVQHEYGHHLVNAGGSGQGQYGEGTGDVMSVIILDNPTLGIGFFGSCGSGLRSAENDLVYPCPTDGHACAPLYSGCVWETRNELVITEPANYTEILNFLAVNSILVHSGSLITPQMTIDWLTLDDDDSDIGNGTPHYAEIAAGFGAHNMDAPVLNLLDISFPSGQPEFVNPNGSSTIVVDIAPLAGVLDASSPTLMVNTGSGFSPVAMSQNSSTQFEANFPATDCGDQVEYYIVSQTDNGTAQNSPTDAPSGGTYTTNAAASAPTTVFEDNFQTNLGWNVSGSVSDGAWERGVPANGNRGDPAADFDGSGQCYVTDNVAGNSDVDGGTTTLTSPAFDNSAGNNSLSYALWYSNDIGVVDDSITVELSNNNGGSWTVVNTVGPNAESGGWVEYSHSIDAVFGAPSSTVMIRFVTGDLGEPSVVEAGVDAVRMTNIDCSTASCPADLTGDGTLNFFDVSAFLTAFGNSDPIADFTGDGTFNFFDVSAFLTAFGNGCP